MIVLSIRSLRPVREVQGIGVKYVEAGAKKEKAITEVLKQKSKGLQSYHDFDGNGASENGS